MPIATGPRKRVGIPPVSVVIPCFNAAPFLGEALESVLVQTHPVLEVIVIDDGSTDGSASIAESFGAVVRVIQQENQGESAARNRGMDESKGDWIALLDADDFWRPTKLEKQLQMVAPGTVCVHTNYFKFGSKGGVFDNSGIPPEIRYSLIHMAISNPFASSSVIVRKDIPARFPLWTRYAEDLIYYLDLVEYGSVRLVPEPLTAIRCHDTNQSLKPEIETYWHQTIEEWVSRNENKLTTEEIGQIKQGWAKRLVTKAKEAKWQRDWQRYWAIRKHLTSFPQYAEVQTLLTERVFPRWLYSLRDRLTRRRAP